MFNLPKQTMHSSHKIVKSANACEGAVKNRQQQNSLLFFWESDSGEMQYYFNFNLRHHKSACLVFDNDENKKCVTSISGG